MNSILGEALAYDDILLVPSKSLKSRRTANTSSRLTKKVRLEVPIISANMDTVTESVMMNAMADFGAIGALHRNNTIQQEVDELKKHLNHLQVTGKEGYPVAASVGVAEGHRERADELVKHGATIIIIDIAHGYADSVADMIKYIKDKHSHIEVIAGNVANGDAVEFLIEAGADCIKAGIGQGCLTSDARILMSNGTYKNIVDVEAGDEVITKNGNSAKVKRMFCTGTKKIRNVRHTNFYKTLGITSGHECFVGDLSTVKRETVSSKGYQRILDKNFRGKRGSKLLWKTLENSKGDAFLLPSNIDFNLPKTFTIKLDEFFIRPDHNPNYKKTIEPSFELGYMLGMFLGDGTASLPTYQRTETTSSKNGAVHWYLGEHEEDFAIKLSNCVEKVTGKRPTSKTKNNIIKVSLYSKQWTEFLKVCGKKENKNLPSFLLADHKDYCEGLLAGLIDSDGHIEKQGRICFSNTSSSLIELFGILTHLTRGYFPNMRSVGFLSSKKVTARNECFKARICNTQGKRLLKRNPYQVVKQLEISDESELEVPVYDLEIDDPSHSFIANNMIVHNSLCSTRLVTGCGVPTITALRNCVEVADQYDIPIIADGSIRYGGDILKAFWAGAESVMVGGLFSATDESPGEVEVINGQKYKEYRGMASHKARQATNTDHKDIAAEGVSTHKPYKGSVKPILQELLGGFKSGMSYVSAETTDMITRAKAYKMTGSGLQESIPHGKVL